MAFTKSLEQQRFSLDDPDVAAKLVLHMEARGVRLAFNELCWHFRCEEYAEKKRLSAFLEELNRLRLVVEVQPRLYCRPALRYGERGVEQEPDGGRRTKKRGRTWGPRDAARTASESAQLLSFARTCKGGIRTRSFKGAADSFGIDRKRVPYLLQHLRARSLLSHDGCGTYAFMTPPIPKGSPVAYPSADAVA